MCKANVLPSVLSDLLFYFYDTVYRYLASTDPLIYHREQKKKTLKDYLMSLIKRNLTQIFHREHRENPLVAVSQYLYYIL